MNPEEYPDIKGWIDGFGGKSDYVDYLTAQAPLGHWLAFSRMFWPQFMSVRGCILWDRVYEPNNFDHWYSELAGDATRIEATLNRLIVVNIIPAEESQTDDSALREIARVIRNCWEAALSAAYPEHTFDVCVADTEDGPVISFITTGDDDT
jgi:hypothetical protein